MEDPKTMEDTTPSPANSWQLVCERIPGQDVLDRIRVDTGWIYSRMVIAGATTGAAGQTSVAMTFVPDRATP